MHWVRNWESGSSNLTLGIKPTGALGPVIYPSPRKKSVANHFWDIAKKKAVSRIPWWLKVGLPQNPSRFKYILLWLKRFLFIFWRLILNQKFDISDTWIRFELNLIANCVEDLFWAIHFSVLLLIMEQGQWKRMFPFKKYCQLLEYLTHEYNTFVGENDRTSSDGKITCLIRER